VTVTKCRWKWSPPTFMLDGREYFLSVARDITRRLELEAELQQP
jgi:hypothetical protein